jgi:hypothetical protein
MAHVYDWEYNRCIFCDCRPWGIHSTHPCTEFRSCSEFHNEEGDDNVAD